MIRTPSVPYGRTTMRASAACSTKSSVRVPSGSQTKFACEGGSVKPATRSAVAHSGAFGDHCVGAGQQLVAGVQRGDRGGLRNVGRGERNRNLVQRGDHSRVADRVADAETSQPVGLRKRSQHNNIAVASGPGPDYPAACRRGCTRRRPRRSRSGCATAPPRRTRTVPLRSTTVDVGLFGLHTKISRVRSVTAASIA